MQALHFSCSKTTSPSRHHALQSSSHPPCTLQKLNRATLDGFVWTESALLKKLKSFRHKPPQSFLGVPGSTVRGIHGRFAMGNGGRKAVQAAEAERRATVCSNMAKKMQAASSMPWHVYADGYIAHTAGGVPPPPRQRWPSSSDLESVYWPVVDAESTLDTRQVGEHEV